MALQRHWIFKQILCNFKRILALILALNKNRYYSPRQNQGFLVQKAIKRINEAHLQQERKLNGVRTQIEQKMHAIESQLFYQEDKVSCNFHMESFLKSNK